MNKKTKSNIQTNDRKFVPAYEKNKIAKKKTKANNSLTGPTTTKFQIRSKLTIIMIVGIVILFVLIGLAIWGIGEYQKYKYYVKYEAEMQKLAFDTAYDNSSCKTNQGVTKSEAVKMLVVAFFNTQDISGFANTPVETYPNAIYVQYAEDKEIVPKGEITSQNQDDKIKYEDVIRYVGNANMKVKDRPLDATNKENIKDIKKYNPDVQNAIADLVNNAVIVPRGNKIRGNSNVFKGQINELVVNISKKYNTVTLGDAKININPDKVPSNVGEYPYTLATVDKSVYEMKFDVNDTRTYLNPVAVFAKKKDYYSRIQETVEKYYEQVLNVNAATISTEQFGEAIKPYVAYKQDTQKIEEYINYVKQNHIQIQGKAEVILPAIYYDGRNYRVRTKLEFEVLSSDTKNNLMYLDTSTGTVVYENTKYALYVDAYLGNALGGDSTLFMKDTNVLSSLIQKENMGIYQEKVGD